MHKVAFLHATSCPCASLSLNSRLPLQAAGSLMRRSRFSAGAVILRQGPGGWRYLLLRVFRTWDFPKGGVEAAKARSRRPSGRSRRRLRSRRSSFAGPRRIARPHHTAAAKLRVTILPSLLWATPRYRSIPSSAALSTTSFAGSATRKPAGCCPSDCNLCCSGHMSWPRSRFGSRRLRLERVPVENPMHGLNHRDTGTRRRPSETSKPPSSFAVAFSVVSVSVVRVWNFGVSVLALRL
jgi:hypothetical protein